MPMRRGWSVHAGRRVDERRVCGSSSDEHGDTVEQLDERRRLGEHDPRMLGAHLRGDDAHDVAAGIAVALRPRGIVWRQRRGVDAECPQASAPKTPTP